MDSVLKRMTIIGVILSFRSLAQEALRDVRHDWSHLAHGQFKMAIFIIIIRLMHRYYILYTSHEGYLVTQDRKLGDQVTIMMGIIWNHMNT